MRISDWSSDVCSSDLDSSGKGAERVCLRQPAFNQVRRSLGRFTSPLAPIRGAVRASARRGDMTRLHLFSGGHPEVAVVTERKLLERNSVVWGKSVSVRVDLGGRRIFTKKKPYS